MGVGGDARETLRPVRRYQETFDEALGALSRSGREARRLLEGIRGPLRKRAPEGPDGLCGMLAAEHPTLPAPMQRALQTFFDANAGTAHAASATPMSPARAMNVGGFAGLTW